MKPKDSIRLYGLYNFFYSFDLYAALKVIFFYKLTNSYTETGSLLGFILLFSALLEVPTGIFSDMIGRKKTIIAGSFCMVLGYLLYALGFNYWILVLGTILEGAALAFFSGNNNAYLHNLLSDQDKQHEYHHFFGKINSLVTVSSVAAVLLGGVIANWSITYFMWLNLIPQIIGLVLAFMLKDIKREEAVNTNVLHHLRDAFREIRGNLNLRYMSLSQILGGGGMAAGELQAAAFAAVWPTWAVGIAKGVQAIGGIPGYYYSGKLIDRFGSVKIIATGTILSVLGNILTGLVRTVISPIFVMLSLPLYGPADTAQQSLLQKEFTERQRATIASLNSLGNSVTAAIVLFICGIIASHYGPFIALLATQVFLIPSLYYKFVFLRRTSRENHS